MPSASAKKSAPTPASWKHPKGRPMLVNNVVHTGKIWVMVTDISLIVIDGEMWLTAMVNDG